MSCTNSRPRVILSIVRCITLTLSTLLASPANNPVYAESQHHSSVRASHGRELTKEQLESNLTSIPVRLPGGSTLTMITPKQWSTMAADLLAAIANTNETHTALFNHVPPFKTSIRLMDEETFFTSTGAPKWTNALFLRGQIMIPISLSEPIDLENIRRSVRHEYTHAVLSALSGGRIPGWIDEGMAQWMEGGDHAALNKALRQWLSTNDPIPFRFLQGGFTRLPNHMVAPAYAQSLVTVQAMLRTYGTERLTAYLNALRSGHEVDDSFRIAFGISSSQLESRLHQALQRWSGMHRSGTVQVAAYSGSSHTNATTEPYLSSRSSLNTR